MNSKSEIFIEYFSLAQRSALSPRESAIIELRYGLTSGEPNLFEVIGLKIGVTRERIRQILDRSLRKIVSKGQREIRSGMFTEPCAELILYLQNRIRPMEDGAVDRLVDFVYNNLSYLPEKYSLSLIAYLAYKRKVDAKSVLHLARQISHTRETSRRKESKNQERCKKFQELISYAQWFSQLQAKLDLTPGKFNRKRHVSLDGRGNAGSYYSNKMDRLVEYESELEKVFFQWLEQTDEVVFYQEQPFKLHYRHENIQHVYYPDVLLILKNGKAIVAEIKPVFGMALNINLVKWSALKKFCADKGYGLLVTDGRYAIQQIQKHEINPNYSKAVLKSLKAGAISWSQYKLIVEEFAPSRNDFVALVLNNRLVWSLNPFVLGSSLSPRTAINIVNT